MNQMLTTTADSPSGPTRVARIPNFCPSAATGYGVRVLRQVLGPQCRLQFLPSVASESQGIEETGLESSVRMFVRQQVIAELLRIDDRVFSVRQQHGAV